MTSSPSLRLCTKAASHGPAAPGLSRCDACLDKAKKLRESRIDKGLCTLNAKHGAAAPGSAVCAGCLARRTSSRKLGGACTNGESHGAAAPGRTLCLACLKSKRAHWPKSSARRRFKRSETKAKEPQDVD